MTQFAITRAVALPSSKKLDWLIKGFTRDKEYHAKVSGWFTENDIDEIIAALKEMKGVADGTHVVVPISQADKSVLVMRTERYLREAINDYFMLVNRGRGQVPELVALLKSLDNANGDRAMLAATEEG